VDARLCISYLTIELKGPIPIELRPRIGNRVFGCDICQEVCPWNDGVEPAPRELLEDRVATPDRGTMIEWAEELLAATDEEFRARYRESALNRPGRDRLLRNLCVGLGNAGSPEAIPLLLRATTDRSELVREHAAWALQRLR
jgi:epoxyqueuosine reductase